MDWWSGRGLRWGGSWPRAPIAPWRDRFPRDNRSIPVESILFALDIVFVVLLVYWTARNDHASPDRPVTGLFAWRDGTDIAPPPAATPSRRYRRPSENA